MLFRSRAQGPLFKSRQSFPPSSPPRFFIVQVLYLFPRSPLPPFLPFAQRVTALDLHSCLLLCPCFCRFLPPRFPSRTAYTAFRIRPVSRHRFLSLNSRVYKRPRSRLKQPLLKWPPYYHNLGVRETAVSVPLSTKKPWKRRFPPKTRAVVRNATWRSLTPKTPLFRNTVHHPFTHPNFHRQRSPLCHQPALLPA